MWKWLQKSKSVKKELFSYKDEALTGFSIFLLIILDIFILSNIIIGIQAEVDKSPKSYFYYPSDCTKHFKKIETSYKGFSYYNYYHKQQSPICTELNTKISIFKKTKTYKENLALIKKLEQKIGKNDIRLNQITEQYNTRLFEQIAKMPNNKALNEAKIEYETIIEDNKKLKKQLTSIAPISTLKGYEEYKNFVNTNKQLFKDNKKSYEFWQPFKEYANMLIFILPLLLFFGFFYFRTKKQQLKGEKYNPIVRIITTHISFILILPIVWYSLALVYHVIPKTLLKNLVEFLVSIGLLSLLNYFILALVVIFFGGLIYFVQKRTARLKQERISKKDYKQLISYSQCFECERKIDYNKNYCPFCATKLHENCKKCNEKTIIHEPYCSNCAAKKD